MLCTACEVNEASVTMIPTGEGDVQSVCSPCMARMGLELAKLTLPAEEIAAILGPMFVDPAREDLHDGAKAEVATRARKRKAKPQPTEPPAAAAESAD